MLIDSSLLHAVKKRTAITAIPSVVVLFIILGFAPLLKLSVQNASSKAIKFVKSISKGVPKNRR